MKNLIHSDSYKHFCIPIGFGTDCHMRHVSFIMRRVYLSLFICINRSFAVFSFFFFFFACVILFVSHGEGILCFVLICSGSEDDNRPGFSSKSEKLVEKV